MQEESHVGHLEGARECMGDPPPRRAPLGDRRDNLSIYIFEGMFTCRLRVDSHLAVGGSLSFADISQDI